jgi:hypothetical protein
MTYFDTADFDTAEIDESAPEHRFALLPRVQE